MKTLKVGIITHNFPAYEKDRTNAGTFVYDLAKILSNDVDIVVFSPGNENCIKKIGGIKTYFFKFGNKLGSLKIYNPIDLLKFITFFLSGKRALENFIKKNHDIDFIISMWAYPSGFFAHSIFRKKRIPYAIYALGSDIYVYAKKPLLRRFIKKYLLDAKFIVADSPDLTKETKKIVNKKTIFLPSSSNFPVIFKSKIKRPIKVVLTFLGRLEKIKGIDLLAGALENLGDDLYRFKINIIGDGSLFKKISKKLSKYPNIKLWGNLSEKEIIEVSKNSDWIIIPSRSDSIPLVFSEAMKLSIPVIASNLPDLAYLVKKYNVGLLFKKNNMYDLKIALKKALIIDHKYFQYRNNTKIVAKIFDLNYTSNKLIELINSNL